MDVPQSGIFALGTASHAYLEFDVNDKGQAPELIMAVAGLREPRTTMGGVNLVAGFRPELWRAAVPDDAPEVEGFNRDVVGPDGYIMPATQHDAVLGSLAARTTLSSTLHVGRSATSSRWPQWPKRPRAGHTITIWTSPGSSTGRRTRA